MADYNLLGEDEKVIRVLGADGKEITIAKNLLSDEMKSKIGSQPPSVPPAEILSPIQEQYNQELQARGLPKDLFIKPGYTPPDVDPVALSAAKNYVLRKEAERAAEAEKEAELAGLARQKQQRLSSLGFGEAPAVKAPAATATSGVSYEDVGKSSAAAIPVGLSGTVQPSVSEYSPGESSLLSSIKNQESLQQSQAKMLESAYQEQQSYFKKIDEEYASKRKELEERAEMQRQDVLSGKIDPHGMWGRMSTGNQILAVISMALGGAASAWTGGRNLAYETIDKAIDRDIKAQEANINNERNALRDLMDQVKDIDSAKSILKNDYLARIQSMTNMMSTRANSAAASTNSRALISQIEESVRKRNAEVAEKRAIALAMQGDTDDNASAVFSMLPKETAEKALVIRDGKKSSIGIAVSADAKKELTEKLRQKEEFDQVLSRYEALFKEGVVLPGTDREGTLSVLDGQALSLLKEITGVRNIEDSPFAKMIPRMKNLDRGEQQARINELYNFIDSRTESVKKTNLVNYKPGYLPGQATKTQNVKFGGK